MHVVVSVKWQHIYIYISCRFICSKMKIKYAICCSFQFVFFTKEIKLQTYTTLTEFGLCKARLLSHAILQGGAFYHLQRRLKKALQPSICLLHHMELPLRRLHCFLDGTQPGLFILSLDGIWKLKKKSKLIFEWWFCH